ncbi:MAG TPA: Ig-like domain-containing protein [Chitinophagaceae bacterium]|nr:Ig-like domain-containing protein [Chitinophagaceae bacterium]
MKSGLILFSIVLLSALGFLSSTGCANIIPPTGGPRDSLPPVLVTANPADSAVNFRGNRIVLTFNEFIDLQEVQNNLLFTPTMENNPVIEARLRTLTLRLRDSLEPNTTYTFNFGNAVRDINEGNILRNFTYTFSTGPVLDSLELRGRVLLAENGRIDSTLTILLHTDFTDSAVANNRPRYVTRVDGQGRFVFRNLPADTFAVYALGEAGFSRRYLNKSQLFAFSDSLAVTGGGATPEVTLFAYRETDPNTTGAPGARPVAGARPAANNRITFTPSTSTGPQDLLDSFTLRFDRPLRRFDSTRVALARDSAFTPVTDYRLRLDTSRTVLSLTHNWAERTEYHLLLDSTFAEDTLGRRLLRSDTVSFSTRAMADYGRLDLRVKNVDAARNPVVQFVQNDRVVLSAPIGSGRFVSPLFLPGEYELRILYDENGNRQWDPGRFFGGRKQPEKIVPIERRITVKAAWGNEFEVSL